MVNGFWGRKVGMTQIFSDDNKVVPVTAVDASGWFVSQHKTTDKDGYTAVQVVYPRKKYQEQDFQTAWLKNKAKYCRWVREIAVTNDVAGTLPVGSLFNFADIIQANDSVDVVGITKGRGFAGVMKRHGFAGGPASHGSNFKRRPGGISFLCSQGKVVKGKPMAGHMGVVRRTAKNLKVMQIHADTNLVLLKGSMAGEPGSLVYVRKCG